MNLLTKRKKIESVRKITAFMAILMILISLLDVIFCNYEVNAADSEGLKVTGSVTSSGNYTVGNPLIITMATSGGTSPYQYQYEYMKSGGSYSVYKSYSAISSITMSTSGWSANVDYNIKVTVKDSVGATVTYTASVRLNAETVQNTTLADLNTLIDKIDTWYSNSIQDSDMQSKIEAWSPSSEHYSTVPFSYAEYTAAYNAAKSASKNGSKDYDTLYVNLETQFDKLKRLVNSGYVSPDLDTGNTPVGFVNSYFLCYKSLIKGISNCFLAMAGSTTYGDLSSIMFSFDFDSAVDKIFSIFKIFAYSIVIILVGVNTLESVIQYELFTMRGGVKIFGRLIFAKLWVDLSLVICRYIIQISMDLLSKITTLTNSLIDFFNIDIHLESSKAWVIGPIIDFLNGLLIGICVSFVLLPLLILVFAIYVKLFIRLFDLAMLQSISPVFFACLTGETTKQYFRKFITTYISVVIEAIFMEVIWYFYIQYTGSMFGDSGLRINNIADIFGSEFLSFMIVSFAVSILVLKPPSILKNLVY